MSRLKVEVPAANIRLGDKAKKDTTELRVRPGSRQLCRELIVLA